MKCILGIGLAFGAVLAAGAPVAPITIDYPLAGSVFPPDIAPPTFIWRDTAQGARVWMVEVSFAGGAAPIRVKARGERMRIGEMDPRCVAPTNELPKLTPEQEAARIWLPDPGVWAEIKKYSVDRAATVVLTGCADENCLTPVSRGQVAIRTSRDPVGAPIFYRDVPLMPSEEEKGVIKPLAPDAVSLVAWRLRNIAEPASRLLLTGMHTCANCHSFSADGKTLGMDLDGPQNDKGLYAISRVAPQTYIRNEDVIRWNSFRDQAAGQTRIGFMSQVSPDGRYVVSTVNPAEKSIQSNYYVANFKDYRFLQVFYPTRGILVYYNRATGRRQALPGADDRRYVHTDAVWSPDGKYLVFARAEAKDPYPPGQKQAGFANDPNENQIQYDLYRIPFNDGQGGQPEPIAGASHNGMSNTFPKVSPDGKWIVFVRCRNGQLMRPDSELYIVPAQGGTSRRMKCNTPLMNSWHSFSPNGRWMVFSSKSRSPYTQMFLTHIDEAGDDTPPILIENSTAANRAVNIPEFVNIPPDGMMKIEAPAAEYYRLFDVAFELQQKEQYPAAIEGWRKALAITPDDARGRNNLGFCFARQGRSDLASAEWETAIRLDPELAQPHNNLAIELWRKGNLDSAIAHWRKAAELDSQSSEAHHNLGVALLRQGKAEEAMAEWRKAVEIDPKNAEAHANLGRALADSGRLGEAIPYHEAALAANPNLADNHNDLGIALFKTGRRDEAIAHFRKAIQLDARFTQAYFNLGNALYAANSIPEAVAAWRTGLRFAPDHVPVLSRTAWVLATCPLDSVRNGAEAVRLASRALELTGGNQPAVLDALAAAYAETGRFLEAVDTARRALALAGGTNEGLEARIALYRAGKPVRDRRQTAVR
jgi:tetratricopeptide (TPR) repeat protein/Tol biopolymer transport system component